MAAAELVAVLRVLTVHVLRNCFDGIDLLVAEVERGLEMLQVAEECESGVAAAMHVHPPLLGIDERNRRHGEVRHEGDDDVAFGHVVLLSHCVRCWGYDRGQRMLKPYNRGQSTAHATATAPLIDRARDGCGRGTDTRLPRLLRRALRHVPFSRADVPARHARLRRG